MSKGDLTSSGFRPGDGNTRPAGSDAPRGGDIQPLAGGLGGATPVLDSMRKPVIFGVIFIALFFGLGGGWAALAPLTGAIIAPGVVSPDGNRRTVQHLEGGIIRTIRVREGQAVEAGEVLIELADVSPQARADAGRGRLRALLAKEARLEAEQRNAETIRFDHPELSDLADPEVAKAIELETNQFHTRRENLENQIGVLQQRRTQLDQQSIGLKIQLSAALEQSALIDQEIADVQSLVDQGLERRPRLLALKRAKADLQGSAGNASARIAEVQEAMGETELRINTVRSDRAERIEAELTAVTTERAQIEQLLKQDRDLLARTEILAPIAGTVLNLRFQTLGGVILPGEAVLDIVPANEELLIDARVAPADIDQVTAGQTAQVVFPAFPQRNVPRLDGEVRTVGADALEDPRDGGRYYAVRIGIEKDEFAKLGPGAELKPGMPAEGYIATGERTLLTYLMRPFLDTLRRSFRET